jgi:hypothetical protein
MKIGAAPKARAGAWISTESRGRRSVATRYAFGSSPAGRRSSTLAEFEERRTHRLRKTRSRSIVRRSSPGKGASIAAVSVSPARYDSLSS